MSCGAVDDGGQSCWCLLRGDPKNGWVVHDLFSLWVQQSIGPSDDRSTGRQWRLTSSAAASPGDVAVGGEERRVERGYGLVMRFVAIVFAWI